MKLLSILGCHINHKLRKANQYIKYIPLVGCRNHITKLNICVLVIVIKLSKEFPEGLFLLIYL